MIRENFEFVSSENDTLACHELKSAVSENLGLLFDSVLTTVADYFEEAQTELI